ncbi:MAG: murein biosynthesis integral membrane protein MurJ [Desulfobacterota bacterium]|nr:murein biosynthesis integral membrane protein MurJ [Thermodesulfobacteriota bacterium]
MSPERQTKTIARSAGTVSIAVFASRIFGLVREQVFAALFGAGFAFDAFVVAFRIPNLLRDLFAEGALSAAFVTVFTDYRTKKGQEETWQLARTVMTAAVLITGAIAVIGAICSGWIVSIMAPDFSRVPGKHSLTTLMTCIMFPFLTLVSLASIVMGILNTFGVFFIPALSSSFFNVGSILTGVALYFVVPLIGLHPIVGMAIGVLCGGLMQLGVQLPALRAQGFRFRPVVNFADAGLRRIGRLMIPAIIGLSATEINIFVNTFFASSCPEGSVSWLNYAFRVLMFPIGLVGVSLSIATMPVVARHASKGDVQQLRDAYVSSTVLSLLFSVPATFGLIFLAASIIRVIFEHGNFTALDTVNTAQALIFYSIGLFAYAGLKIIVPVFYALNKTRYPVIGSFIGVVMNIVIVLATLRLFQHRAIALSTSLCIIANFIFLVAALYRELKGFALGYIARCCAKIVPISLFMGVVVYMVDERCRHLLGGRIFENLISLLIAIVCGTLLYALLISKAGIQEVTPIKRKILSYLTGKAA